MLEGALTIGGPGTGHISWESAATFFGRKAENEITLRASTWTRAREHNRPGTHPLLNFVSCPVENAEH